MLRRCIGNKLSIRKLIACIYKIIFVGYLRLIGKGETRMSFPLKSLTLASNPSYRNKLCDIRHTIFLNPLIKERHQKAMQCKEKYILVVRVLMSLAALYIKQMSFVFCAFPCAPLFIKVLPTHAHGAFLLICRAVRAPVCRELGWVGQRSGPLFCFARAVLLSAV